MQERKIRRKEKDVVNNVKYKKMDKEIYKKYVDLSGLFGGIVTELSGVYNTNSEDAKIIFSVTAYKNVLYIENLLNCELSDLKQELKKLIGNDEIIKNTDKQANEYIMYLKNMKVC